MSASERTNNEPRRGAETVKPQQYRGQLPDEGYEVPLFLRDRSDGQKENAQDEKDEVGE